MSTSSVEQRLRTFLLVTSASLCLGTVIELLLAEHYGDAVQLVPFVLCGVGLAAILAALRSPARAALLALRGVMALLLLGSLFGVYEHLEGNAEFALELRPGAALGDVLIPTLTGAAPLLAPGILALAAALAIAATYQHPALKAAVGSGAARQP